jgi:hypothetical protein
MARHSAIEERGQDLRDGNPNDELAVEDERDAIVGIEDLNVATAQGGGRTAGVGVNLELRSRMLTSQ